MKFTKPRATLEETHAFANAVREAGGGNPLDALMPAVPEDSTQCLIAKNLNFNCAVQPSGKTSDNFWVMVVYDKEVRDRIASALGLRKINDPIALQQEDVEVPVYGVRLPQEIANVAMAFDEWMDASHQYHNYGRSYLDEDTERLLEEFTPYVEASVREARGLGDFNEKGELIL